jgi:hypothetical protein
MSLLLLGVKKNSSATMITALLSNLIRMIDFGSKAREMVSDYQSYLKRKGNLTFFQNFKS